MKCRVTSQFVAQLIFLSVGFCSDAAAQNDPFGGGAMMLDLGKMSAFRCDPNKPTCCLHQNFAPNFCSCPENAPDHSACCAAHSDFAYCPGDIDVQRCLSFPNNASNARKRVACCIALGINFENYTNYRSYCCGRAFPVTDPNYSICVGSINGSG